MIDTIVLPKSGVVLTRPTGTYIYSAEVAPSVIPGMRVELWPKTEYVRPRAIASWRDEGTRQNTNEECLAWLDARVLELRAALLPDHDAMLDTIGEAIARASDEYVGGSCECDDDDDDPAPYAKRCAACKAGPRHVARAVLAAIAEGGKS